MFKKLFHFNEEFNKTISSLYSESNNFKGALEEGIKKSTALVYDDAGFATIEGFQYNGKRFNVRFNKDLNLIFYHQDTGSIAKRASVFTSHQSTQFKSTFDMGEETPENDKIKILENGLGHFETFKVEDKIKYIATFGYWVKKTSKDKEKSSFLPSNTESKIDEEQPFLYTLLTIDTKKKQYEFCFVIKNVSEKYVDLLCTFHFDYEGNPIDPIDISNSNDQAFKDMLLGEEYEKLQELFNFVQTNFLKKNLEQNRIELPLFDLKKLASIIINEGITTSGTLLKLPPPTTTLLTHRVSDNSNNDMPAHQRPPHPEDYDRTSSKPSKPKNSPSNTNGWISFGAKSSLHSSP